MVDFPTVLAVTTLAGLATGVGALPLFARRSVSHRTYDAAVGLAAGIMFAASVFALIIPGMEEGGLAIVTAGVFAGGVGLLVANRFVPHVHEWYRERVGHGGVNPVGESANDDRTISQVDDRTVVVEVDPTESDWADDRESRFRRALLVGAAITLHNGPEGLAMGVAFASGLEEVAIVLAVVIGLQNVPDGFAFAVPMGETGMSNARVLMWTTLSGVVPQVSAAAVGYFLVALATGLFPIAAGFAAGAMMAVVFREMIPSSHSHGYADAATAAFLVGFTLLVVVDTVLVL